MQLLLNVRKVQRVVDSADRTAPSGHSGAGHKEAKLHTPGQISASLYSAFDDARDNSGRCCSSDSSEPCFPLVRGLSLEPSFGLDLGFAVWVGDFDGALGSMDVAPTGPTSGVVGRSDSESDGTG